jgi:hypothetical protein
MWIQKYKLAPKFLEKPKCGFQSETIGKKKKKKKVVAHFLVRNIFGARGHVRVAGWD